MKVLFKCDEWKSRNSMEFLGVFDNDSDIQDCISNNDLVDENGLEYFYTQSVEMNEEV